MVKMGLYGFFANIKGFTNIPVFITTSHQIEDFHLKENYGQLHVSDIKTMNPLPTVYVKVYARMKNGQDQFYKDGYTDLRGRFDYSSLNTTELENVDRFAILVLSESHGAVVREASVPKQ